MGDEPARIRGVIAMLVAGYAVADLTGSEPILGGFLAGIVVSSLPSAMKSATVQAVRTLGYGFLVPMFFLTTGLHLPLGFLANADGLLWIPVFITLSTVVKLFAAWPLIAQYGRRRAVAGGILLSSRLSLVLATANIGVRLDAMSTTLANAVTVAVVITCLLAPVAFESLSHEPTRV